MLSDRGWVSPESVLILTIDVVISKFKDCLVYLGSICCVGDCFPD